MSGGGDRGHHNNDNDEDDAPPRPRRFRDRLCFQAYPRPAGRAFGGVGPRDCPLEEIVRLRRTEARTARRRAVEARKTPTAMFGTRAVKLRR